MVGGRLKAACHAQHAAPPNTRNMLCRAHVAMMMVDEVEQDSFAQSPFARVHLFASEPVEQDSREQGARRYQVGAPALQAGNPGPLAGAAFEDPSGEIGQCLTLQNII